MRRALVAVSLVVALFPAPAVAVEARGPGPPHHLATAPVPGVVMRPFDAPETTYGAGHRGVDLAARAGQPVGAAMAGTVTFSGTVARVGWVTVDHGGSLRTTYGPLSPRAVSAGDVVGRGDVLGFVAARSSHVDWGARLGEDYVDPRMLLDRWETYLVPADEPSMPALGGLPLEAGGAPARLVWPLEATVTSTFGDRRHPITGRRRHHAGIDIAGRAGERVSAAAPGTVTFAGVVSGYGNTVVIDHGGGTSTLYAHLDAITTAAGDTVAPGGRVGTVGSTGTATGPHLHFEVRRAGLPQDPLPLLPR